MRNKLGWSSPSVSILYLLYYFLPTTKASLLRILTWFTTSVKQVEKLLKGLYAQPHKCSLTGFVGNSTVISYAITETKRKKEGWFHIIHRQISFRLCQYISTRRSSWHIPERTIYVFPQNNYTLGAYTFYFTENSAQTKLHYLHNIILFVCYCPFLRPIIIHPQFLHMHSL